MSPVTSNQSTKTLYSYPEVSRFIAELLGVDGWDGDSEYYAFSSVDTTEGFLEVVYPFADSSGRLLRGASGNGPIFILLYRRGTWKHLGEMYGARATAIATSSTTRFKVYSHASAMAGVERQYEFCEGQYTCVSEEEVAADDC